MIHWRLRVSHRLHHLRMMTDSSSEPGYFGWSGPEECEIFVATIQREALEQGRERDNEWIAFLASSQLTGDALYWYVRLEEDVQDDWSLLRPALLATFGRAGGPPSATSSTPAIPAFASPTTIPTSAAAPPTTCPGSLARKGRLKVLNSDGSPCGYIAKSGETDGLYNTCSTNPDDALLVSLKTPSSGEAFEIEIIDDLQSSRAIDYLAIRWGSINGQSNVRFVATCCSFSKRTSMQFWEITTKVWSTFINGDLCVSYPIQERHHERLQPFIRQSTNRIYWLSRSRVDTRGHVLVRIVFEDLV